MKHSMRTNLAWYEGTCVAFGHTMRNLCLVFVYERMRVHQVLVRSTYRTCELCVCCVCVWWIVV